MRQTILLLTCLVLGAASAPTVALRSGRAIELPGVQGRIDHMAVDVKGRRLFLAALGNNSVEVIDLAAGKQIQSLTGMKEPQGIAFAPDANRVIVASGPDGSCRVFDGTTLKLLSTIEGLEDADNVRYDERSHRAFVGFGSGALAVIDPGTAKKIAEIKLEDHPESFQLEKTGSRIFVNVPPAGHVAVIDRAANKVIATWPIAPAAANFPMALDEPDHRLFVGCRKPAKVVVFDTESGKPVADIPCVSDTDDLFYDAAHHRIYVSGGGGSVTVIDQKDPAHYAAVATVPTAPGARTSIFVAELGTLYVAAPKRGDQGARLIEFRTDAPQQ